MKNSFKLKVVLLTISLLTFFVPQMNCQVIQMNLSTNNGRHAAGNHIVTLPDSSSIVAGYDYELTNATITNPNVLIFRVSKSGNILWQRRIKGVTGSSRNIATSLKLAANGTDVLMSLYSQASTYNNSTGMLYRFDRNTGAKQWEVPLRFTTVAGAPIHATEGDHLTDFAELSDGRIICVGYKRSAPSVCASAIWVLSATTGSTAPTLQYAEVHDAGSSDGFNSIVIEDNTCYIAGSYYDASPPWSEVAVWSYTPGNTTASSGTINWRRIVDFTTKNPATNTPLNQVNGGDKISLRNGLLYINNLSGNNWQHSISRSSDLVTMDLSGANLMVRQFRYPGQSHANSGMSVPLGANEVLNIQSPANQLFDVSTLQIGSGALVPNSRLTRTNFGSTQITKEINLAGSQSIYNVSLPPNTNSLEMIGCNQNTNLNNNSIYLYKTFINFDQMNQNGCDLVHDSIMIDTIAHTNQSFIYNNISGPFYINYNFTLPIDTPNIIVEKVCGSLCDFTASISATDIEICAGQSTTLTALTSTSGSHTYKWYAGSSSTVLGTNVSYTTSTPGTYKVEVTRTLSNGTTCVDFATITIKLVSALNVNITPIGDICTDTVHLTTNYNGAGYTYAWTKNSSSAVISTAPSFKPSSLQAGVYNVTVSKIVNGTVCVSGTASYTIDSIPNLDITGDTSLCDTVVNGMNCTLLTAQASGGFVRYAWSTSLGGIPFSNVNSVVICSPGKYYVTVTGSNGCQEIDSVTVTSCCKIDMEIIGDTIICDTMRGISLTVSVKGKLGRFIYTWDDGTSGTTRTIFHPGTYYVTVCEVTDTDTCCSVDSIVVKDCCDIELNIHGDHSLCVNGSATIHADILNLDPKASYSYNWSDGSTSNPLIVTQEGTYKVTVCKTVIIADQAFTCCDSGEFTVIDTCTTCTDTCDWHTNGNSNIMPWNFIGPRNAEDFRIRTNNAPAVTITNHTPGTDNARLLMQQSTTWNATPNTSNLIGVNSPSNDQRLRITAGSTDPMSGADGAAIDLHGNNTVGNRGKVDLVAGSAANGTNPAVSVWTYDASGTQNSTINVTGDGLTGIGVNLTNPTHRLHVEGDARVTQMPLKQPEDAIVFAARQSNPATEGELRELPISNNPNQYLAGDGNWHNLPTLLTTNSLVFTNPNTITSTVNGVSSSTTTVGSVSNTSIVNSISTTVNGITGNPVPIINSNILNYNSITQSLTSEVNGVISNPITLSIPTGNFWSLTGNASTNPTNNFVGTTDAQDLAFRTNNLRRLQITQTGRLDFENTSGGSTNIFLEGGNEGTTGNSNTAIGNDCLTNVSSGSSNTSIGSQSLRSNTTGSSNTAVGSLALENSTTGFNNTAVGDVSLWALTSGFNNSAYGVGAGSNLTTGWSNLFIGDGAATMLPSGIENVFVGSASASNLSTMAGNSGLQSKTNTIIGYNAGSLYKTPTSGGTNPLQVANNSVYLGANIVSGSPGSSTGAINEIVIGTNAIGNGNNTATYGDTNIVRHLFPRGKVGVGLPWYTVPANDLHINGGARITNMPAIANPTRLIVSDGTSDLKSLNFVAGGTRYLKEDGTWGTGGTSTGNFWNLTGNANAVAPTSAIGTTVNNNFIGTTNAIPFVLATNNLERMRIDANGNLGVRVAVPNALVHITNSVKPTVLIGTSTSNSNVRMNGASTSIETGILTVDQANYGGQAGILIKGNSTSSNYPVLGFSLRNNAATPIDVLGSQIVGVPTSIANNAESMDLAIYTKANTPNTSSSEKMRITSAGNVGIGLISPNTPLHVRGVVTADNGVGTGYSRLSGGTTSTNGSFAGHLEIYRPNGDRSGYIGWDPTNLVYVAENGARHIFNGGNLGIGVIPTQALHVNGQAIVNNTFIGDVGHGPNWAGFRHNNRTSNADYAIIASADGAHTLINKANTGNGWIGFRIGNGNDVMRIENAGNVGIGTADYTIAGGLWGSATGTIRLSVLGNVKSAGYYQTSDQNLKKDISPIENASLIISKLEGKSYFWTDEYLKEAKLHNSRRFGFIAQDLEKVIPEAVIMNDEGKYAVDYSTIIPILTESQKEIIKDIESLKSAEVGQSAEEIAKLKSENARYKIRNSELMKEKIRSP
jgi:hypothetical protein